MSEFIINCIVLHCSADTVHCECFHCELQCLVGTCVRLQPTGPRRQAGGTPPRVANTWRLVVRPGRWVDHAR